MQILTSSMASTVLLGLGPFYLAALAQRRKPTKGLAAAFQPTQETLASATAARERAEADLAARRVAARFSEFALERAIREIALLAHRADNNADSGPAFRSLFPDGRDAKLRPRAAAQLAAANRLRARLDGQPAAAGVRGGVAATFDKALAALGSALEARQSDERALGIARANEDGARETFVAAYDSNAGAIRQMFPPATCPPGLHFDEFRERRVTVDDSDVHPGPAPATAAPGGLTLIPRNGRQIAAHAAGNRALGRHMRPWGIAQPRVGAAHALFRERAAGCGHPQLRLRHLFWVSAVISNDSKWLSRMNLLAAGPRRLAALAIVLALPTSTPARMRSVAIWPGFLEPMS